MSSQQASHRGLTRPFSEKEIQPLVRWPANSLCSLPDLHFLMLITSACRDNSGWPVVLLRGLLCGTGTQAAHCSQASPTERVQGWGHLLLWSPSPQPQRLQGPLQLPPLCLRLKGKRSKLSAGVPWGRGHGAEGKGHGPSIQAHHCPNHCYQSSLSGWLCCLARQDCRIAFSSFSWSGSERRSRVRVNSFRPFTFSVTDQEGPCHSPGSQLWSRFSRSASSASCHCQTQSQNGSHLGRCPRHACPGTCRTQG